MKVNEKFYVLVVNKNDYSYSYVTYIYEDALRWFDELFEEIKDFYPAKGVIMNRYMDVVYKRGESGEM